jgi:hypothetical protein
MVDPVSPFLSPIFFTPSLRIHFRDPQFAMFLLPRFSLRRLHRLDSPLSRLSPAHPFLTLSCPPLGLLRPSLSSCHNHSKHPLTQRHHLVHTSPLLAPPSAPAAP